MQRFRSIIFNKLQKILNAKGAAIQRKVMESVISTSTHCFLNIIKAFSKVRAAVQEELRSQRKNARKVPTDSVTDGQSKYYTKILTYFIQRRWTFLKVRQYV